MTSTSLNKIAFIGAGNMARAIIIGFIDSGVPANHIMVANPSSEKRLALSDEFGVLQTCNNTEAARFADIILLCVKPHYIEEVCQQLTNALDISKKLFISVAAGVLIKQIHKALSCNASVVRVMPNTPSQLGLGMSGLFASDQVSTLEKSTSNALISAIGKVIWLDCETKINAISAISGSGPAYYFLFMEAMQQQAQHFGFNKHEARMLVEQTALGAAQMVAQSDIEISTLRANVTSKGGTTYAALTQFKDDGLANIVQNAMNAALAHAEEMSQDN